MISQKLVKKIKSYYSYFFNYLFLLNHFCHSINKRILINLALLTYLC